MQLLLLIAAVLQLSAGALASEFFIYAGQVVAVNTGFSNSYHAFAFFSSRPEQCTPGNLNPIRYYATSDDVSHGRQGVVCEGDGCPWGNMDPDQIMRLEFSTNFGHFTYYKGPAQELVGLDGNVYGHCYAMPLYANSIDCRTKLDEVYRGWSYFWCKLDNVQMTDNPGP